MALITVALTPERFALLTSQDFMTDSSSADCSLITYGDWFVPEAGLDVHGAIWFLNNYIPEKDILDGVIIVPEGQGYSEHGSVTGHHLMSCAREVISCPPISFADVLAFTQEDGYARALAYVTTTLERRPDSRNSGLSDEEIRAWMDREL